jgi:hypothetical protein
LALVAATATTGGLLVQTTAAKSATVGEDPAATYQTNGRVNAIITVGNKIFIGGDFTKVRPAGSPPGTGDVTRERLAAFSAVTGKLLAWNPSANSTVNALAASPNGHRIYVGGKFGRLGRHPRHNLGAVLAGSGALTRFRADTDRRVLALAATRKRLYVGGKITKIKGKRRSRLAAVSTTGRVLPTWKPAANGYVRTIVPSANGKDVFVGGDFTRIAGKKQHHLAKLAVKKARVQRFKQHPRYPVIQIVATRHTLFLAGNGAGGHAASYTARGKFRWVKQTDGAVHSVALLGGALYVGGQYANICTGNASKPTHGFNCPHVLAPRRHLAALARANGAPLAWNPGANSVDGVFAMRAMGRDVYVGGDFTALHGVDQQGFGAFAPSQPAA